MGHTPYMASAGSGDRWIILLLRGINLAGRHRVAMGELRSMLTEMGYADARTHLQSGNVLLRSSQAPDRVVRTVGRQLSSRFGFEVPVLVRTAEEMDAVIARDPFGESATDPARYVVTFLPVQPKPSALVAVEGEDFGDERFAVHGREVYQWCPGGQQDSPMLKALNKAAITTPGTARNWRTVTRLAELAAE